MNNDIKVAGRYHVEEKLGGGTFGDVFAGADDRTGRKVAIKLERTELQESQLSTECECYRALRGGCGIPAIHWAGPVGCYNVMVMERLGLTLQDLLEQCGGRLSLKSVLMLADQLLQRLEYVHSRGFLHRDIKPENIAVGKVGGDAETQNLCYLIDFGLAKRYLQAKSSVHIPYREGEWVIGTFRFASLNAHQGIELSRRDDLLSLGYTLVYLLKGSLPWQGLQVTNRAAKNKQVAALKRSTSVSALCEGCPAEFRWYFKYCQQLRFERRPDYSFLREQFRELFAHQGFVNDNIYDWDCPPATPLEAPAPEQEHQEQAEEPGSEAKEAVSHPEEEQNGVFSDSMNPIEAAMLIQRISSPGSITMVPGEGASPLPPQCQVFQNTCLPNSPDGAEKVHHGLHKVPSLISCNSSSMVTALDFTALMC